MSGDNDQVRAFRFGGAHYFIRGIPAPHNSLCGDALRYVLIHYLNKLLFIDFFQLTLIPFPPYYRINRIRRYAYHLRRDVYKAESRVEMSG